MVGRACVTSEEGDRGTKRGALVVRATRQKEGGTGCKGDKVQGQRPPVPDGWEKPLGN